MLPPIVLGPVIGALIDRWNRKTVMLAADGVVAVASLLLAWLFSAGIGDIPHVLALLFLRGDGNRGLLRARPDGNRGRHRQKSCLNVRPTVRALKSHQSIMFDRPPKRPLQGKEVCAHIKTRRN